MATPLTFTPFCFLMIYFALGLLSNRSQKTTKPGQNFSETFGCALCAIFLILPHFDARQCGIYQLDLSSYLIPPALCITMYFPFLLSRISLVNSAIVAYFIQDLHINRHFDLFKKLLFMEDGEFSLSLSNQLFEKVFFLLPFFSIRGRKNPGLTIFPPQILHDWRFSWSCNPHL